jgi:hypothetical protein
VTSTVSPRDRRRMISTRAPCGSKDKREAGGEGADAMGSYDSMRASSTSMMGMSSRMG